MHIRERDVLVEIVDPATGAVLPAGEEGEVVVTTLRREALPVIRYRTGDISRIVPDECPCGGSLRRLDRVHGHALMPGDDGWHLEAALDEAVFSLPGVFDYEARIVGGEGGCTVVMTVESFGETDVRGLAGALGESLPIQAELKVVDDGVRLRNPKLSRLS